MSYLDDPAYHVALAALRPGTCKLLMRFTVATVRDESGQVHTIDIDQRDFKSMLGLLHLAKRAVNRGTEPGLMSAVDEYRHADDCPLCADAHLPGPPVWGMWVRDTTDYYHEWHDFLSANDLERFANVDVARQTMATYTDGLIAQAAKYKRGLALTTWEISPIARSVRKPPAIHQMLVDVGTQLWLFNAEPTGPLSSWQPDSVLFIEDDACTELPGPQFHSRMQKKAAASRARSKTLADHRAQLPWGIFCTRLSHHVVRWYTDGVGRRTLITVMEPERDRPARQLQRGEWAPHRGPAGLSVFGSYSGEGPSFDTVKRLFPELGDLLDAVEGGRGRTTRMSR